MNLIKRICRRFCGCFDYIPIPATGVDLTVEERATAARQIKANPLWEPLFDALRADAHKMWFDTTTDDVNAREYLWTHTQILGVIQRRINGYIAHAILNEDLEKKRQKNPQSARNGK